LPRPDRQIVTHLGYAYPHSSAAFVCDLTTDGEVAHGTRQGRSVAEFPEDGDRV
jgi:hypothetical protein